MAAHLLATTMAPSSPICMWLKATFLNMASPLSVTTMAPTSTLYRWPKATFLNLNPQYLLRQPISSLMLLSLWLWFKPMALLLKMSYP